MAKQIELLTTPQGTGVSPAFARHETFHPRYGWLKKGFDAMVNDRFLFVRDEAPVILGVGKNMVRSIRYWCDAFKLLDNDDPSEFGTRLLGENGWDPYLEDPASLWLLHWNLLKTDPECIAAAWYFAFNLFRKAEFTTDGLISELSGYAKTFGRKIAESSLKKDITCILRMYTVQPSRKGPNEDTLDCPFAELGLIQFAGDSKHYSFRMGSKPNLPAEIIVAACLEFAGQAGQERGTISLSRLLYDPGSPGMAFKLTESALSEAIEQVVRAVSSISLSDSAGLIQFAFTESPEELARSILDGYYATKSGVR